MKRLLILLLTVSYLFSLQNISLTRILRQFKGDEYNILIAPKLIVVSGRKRKTRKAINKGYVRAILELKRQLRLKGINCNMKAFSKNGSDLPQYINQDKKAYWILKDMLKQQIDIREQLNIDFSQPKQSNKQIRKKISAKDIDIDIDDSAFNISNDKVNINNQVISPAEAFISSYIELSSLYNQEVNELYKVWHPFNINGKPVMKHVHSVFGMAFFPTKYGAVKLMRIYVILANINTEKGKSVQIIAKEIPNFVWHRNYLYINAATGKILRQIISTTLGETISTQ